MPIQYGDSNRSCQKWHAIEKYPPPSIPDEAKEEFKEKYFIGYGSIAGHPWNHALYLNGLMLETWMVEGDDLKVGMIYSSEIAPAHVFNYFTGFIGDLLDT